MSVHAYRPGGWIALVGDGAVALLHPDIGPAAARELWELTRTGSRLATWVEHLAGGGIRSLPSFAMVEAHPGGLSVLVRGQAEVVVGDEHVSGAGYTTWREAVLPGGSGFTITADGGSAGVDWLPVVAGIVLAGAVRSDPGEPHAGLRLAGPAEEEDVELTLMRAPALAAAIGRPVLPADAPDPAPASRPAVAPGPVEPVPSEPAAKAQHADVAAPEHAAAPAAVAGAVPARTEADGELDPGEDAEYDHLLWSTEQLAEEDARAEVAAARADEDAAGASTDEPDDDGELPDTDPDGAPAGAGGPAGHDHRGLEATRVPDEEVGVPDGGPVPPAAAPTGPPPGLIDSVPWARPAVPAPARTPVPAPGAAPPTAPPAAAPAVPAAPPTPAPPPADEGDHDGLTVLPGDLPDVPPVAHDDGPAPEETALELVLSTGPRVSVNRPVLLGRAPEAARFRGDAVPRLVAVPNPEREISGTHVEVRPAGDHVVVTDMNSTNGTVVTLPDQAAFRLHPGTGVPVPPGGVVELGSGITLTVVVAGEDG